MFLSYKDLLSVFPVVALYSRRMCFRDVRTGLFHLAGLFRTSPPWKCSDWRWRRHAWSWEHVGLVLIGVLDEVGRVGFGVLVDNADASILARN